MMQTKQLGQIGKQVVLLHGWGRSGKDLLPLAELLANQFRVYLVDLPGFGETPPPEEVWGSLEYATVVKEWMEQSGLKEVILIGHSFGGKVAAQIASRWPEFVDQLVLVASAGIPSKFSVRKKGIQVVGKGLKFLWRNKWQEWFVPRFASNDYKQAGAMRSILVRSVNENLENVFSSIKLPTLVLWGEEDRETPLYMGERIHQLIENSTMICLPHHGHDLFENLGYHLVAACLDEELAQCCP